MWKPAASLLASALLFGAGDTFPSPVLQSIELAGTNSTSIRPRTDPWHYCPDDTWKPFTEGSFVKGLRIMGRKDNDYKHGIKPADKVDIPLDYTGVQGKCVNIWCSNDGPKGVVFYLCLPKDKGNAPYPAKDLAQMFHDGYHDCNSKQEPVTGSSSTRAAFHVWADGYDLHVEGGYEGMKCPDDTNKSRFPRPDSLDKLGRN